MYVDFADDEIGNIWKVLDKEMWVSMSEWPTQGGVDGSNRIGCG